MKLKHESILKVIARVANHDAVVLATTVALLTLFAEYAHAQCVPSYIVVAMFVALSWVSQSRSQAEAE